MFSNHIVDTDAFLDMPATSQLLYFHLSMRADDEGFVDNPKKIMRMCGFQDDDLKVLVAKRFLLTFQSGVVVIKHWLIHNTIRMDRFHETNYIEEKKALKIKKNKAYTEVGKPDGNQMATGGCPKLSKVKLSKAKISKVNITSDVKTSQETDQIMKIFYKINPTLNWGNKTTRKACADLIKRFGLENTVKMAEAVVAVQGKRFAPTITTPYQMKEKLAQLKIYFDREKDKKPKISFIS